MPGKVLLDSGEWVLVPWPPAPGPLNRGHACVNGRFAHGFVRSPDRLVTPLIRRDGELQPAAWDDALGFISERLGRIRAEYGPDAIAAISSSRATNEENYLFQKLMRAGLGTHHIGQLPPAGATRRPRPGSPPPSAPPAARTRRMTWS